MKQAKKRDHKIMITDVAIRKVPVVYIPQFSQNACEWIADEHRELLNIAREQNNSDEVLFVLFGQEQKSIILVMNFRLIWENLRVHTVFLRRLHREMLCCCTIILAPIPSLYPILLYFSVMLRSA